MSRDFPSNSRLGELFREAEIERNRTFIETLHTGQETRDDKHAHDLFRLFRNSYIYPCYRNGSIPPPRKA